MASLPYPMSAIDDLTGRHSREIESIIPVKILAHISSRTLFAIDATLNFLITPL